MSSSIPNQVSRRSFLVSAAAVGGGLLVGFRVPTAGGQSAAEGGALAPNAFVRVDKTGAITVTLPYVEMGQGAYTAQAQLLAEELEVDIEQLTLEHAPADEALYSHPVFGDQITGGSAGLRGAWEPLRRAGATTRLLLTQAAARQWRVNASSCTAERGEIVHARSGRRATYAELVDAAASLPIPKNVPLKSPEQFKIVGKSVKRVDTPDKVNGRAKFGIDALPRGVKFAAVAACPVFGGRVASIDDSAAKSIRGVRQIARIDDAVAVIADHTWAARKGLAALKITWNEGANANIDTQALVRECDAALDRAGVVAITRGDIAAAQTQATSYYDAEFRLPMLAHLAMEPINCTAHVRKDSCEIWVGCQRLAMARRMAAEALGLSPRQVTVHNYLLGGGFGRRLEADYVAQAVQIARQVEGPVKVIWSREEDVQHDYFRYHNHSRLRIGLDAKNAPVSFSHKLVGPAVMARWLPVFFQKDVDLDIVSVATGAYAWPHVHVEYVRVEPPVGLNVGNWRGVGASRNAFIVESAIDDLAHRAGQDPLAYRRALLTGSPRLLNVLDRAAELAQWGSPLPPGRGRGISVLDDFGSYVAQVAEVTVDRSGSVRVERVVCVVDCGLAVNPDIVKAQLEGGIVYGVTAALHGKITVANGRIQQSNFDDCPVLRMHDSPRIEVQVVSSAEAPGGVGEPGTAAVFPAVTNAIFAATGKRLFNLPIDPQQLRTV
jgi:isoquinoline 1-oxidoreductase subunit beta